MPRLARPRPATPAQPCHALPSLAYLTDTYVPRGATKAEAMTGFFVRIDRRGQVWRATKGTVQIGWGDVVQSWRRQPSADQITRARRAGDRATGSAS